MKPRILITLPLPDQDRSYALERLRNAECRLAPSAQTPPADLEWAQIIFGNLVPATRLLEFPNIRWLHSPNAGLDSYQGLEEKRPGLRISNCAGISNDAVAEHALALFLAISRFLPLLIRQQAERRWQREPYIAARCPTWPGRQIHVLGYGAIAQAFIQKLSALSAEITVYRRKGGEGTGGIRRFLPLDRLTAEIGDADALINLLPGLDATRKIVSREVFAAMKSGVFFVNVGRGTTVDEAALAEVLQAGKLAGAALDVFENEPLPPESPLWHLPNVLVSPHVAGRYDLEWERQINGFAGQLADSPG